jgi:hypothetical protein
LNLPLLFSRTAASYFKKDCIQNINLIHTFSGEMEEKVKKRGWRVGFFCREVEFSISVSEEKRGVVRR